MKRYRVSLPARDDLREITRYVRRDNPRAAATLQGKLEAAFVRLANQPGIGHRRADLFDQPELRVWTVERYLIVYRHHPGEGIGIVRVLHGSRDVAGLLADEPPLDE